MLKWIGILLLVVAGAVIASDLYGWMTSGGFRLTALGEWWFWIDKDSLQVLQPAIERHISVSLWDNVGQPLLEGALAVELAVVGLLFLGLARVFRRR